MDTSDPEDAYKYWAGESPSESLKVLHGKYWKSGHWTYEFEVFLHVKATENWKFKFIEVNNLQPASQRLELPKTAPDWFKPPESAVTYTPNGAYTGPFFLEDTVNNEIFIYEIQL